MPSRNAAKAEAAGASIRAVHPAASLEVIACDLSSQSSTKRAAGEIRDRHQRIDLLVANAGVMAIPRRISEDGWEMQLATNHLGHWTFIGLLLDRMLDVEGSQVVSVPSEVHKAGRIDFDDPHAELRYRRCPAYAQHNHDNLLFPSQLSTPTLDGRPPPL